MYKQNVEIEGEIYQLCWENRQYAEFSIQQNGTVLATIPSLDALKAGANVLLPGNKKIMVILSESHGLELWYNGRECISDSRSGDVDYFRQAGYGLIAVGVIYGVIGLIASLSMISHKEGLIVLGATLLIAGVFIGTGIWGIKTYNKAAYWVGLIFCVIALLLKINLFSLIIFGFLTYYCYKATQAIPPKHKVVRDDDIKPFDFI